MLIVDIPDFVSTEDGNKLADLLVWIRMAMI